MVRKRKKYHYIYKTTNLINEKYYIGMHSTHNLNDGYMGSGRRLRYSINKYGKENHVVEILEFVDSREELIKREEEIVNLNEIAKLECMNLRIGGTGGFSSKQQKENAKKSNEKQKILRKNDPEWVDKYSKRITESQLKAYEEGRRKKTYFYDRNGKSHSDETKKKISESKKGKGLGEENSQFGTCWITKDGENKKIKKDLLSNYEKSGWVRGKVVKGKYDDFICVIFKLRELNTSYNKISKLLGIPKSSVIDVCKKNNEEYCRRED